MVCQYVDLCFHALSLPCLPTFWHAIPTSFYIFKSCFCTFFMLISVTVRPKPISSVITTPELETALTSLVVVPGMYQIIMCNIAS